MPWRSMSSSRLRAWPYFWRAILPSLALIALGVVLRVLSDTPSLREVGGLLALTGLGCVALAVGVFVFLHWRGQL